jgi:hypothetical protein
MKREWGRGRREGEGEKGGGEGDQYVMKFIVVQSITLHSKEPGKKEINKIVATI